MDDNDLLPSRKKFDKNALLVDKVILPSFSAEATSGLKFFGSSNGSGRGMFSSSVLEIILFFTTNLDSLVFSRDDFQN